MLTVWILLRRPDLDREAGPHDPAPKPGDEPGA
jgi:hypothetical protein